jgi:cytochrome P450
MWSNNRIMKNYLLPHIERGVVECDKFEGPKTINHLAIRSYMSEVQDSSSRCKIDSHFIDVVIAQMKLLIFAGYETTTSTLAFAYHLLCNNPAVLATMRSEHDAVFGPDPTEAAAKIATSPGLLNQLPYTSAVIKETLRLFPPVGTVRAGQRGFFLTHPDTGTLYPTEGFMLFGCSLAEQRHEEFWPQAAEFVPERWFAREGNPLHVRKNAFRPFELGPRNCIGQELAQLELRMILVLTAREFDIESVLPEDGGRVLGELAYQVMRAGQVTGHPIGGMPVRVTMRG